MKRNVVLMFLVSLMITVLSGCILSHTPESPVTLKACSESQTFAVTGVLNGPYVWSKNDVVISGVTGPSYTYTAICGDVGTFVLKVKTTCLITNQPWAVQWTVTVVPADGGLVLQGTETRLTYNLADQYDPAISSNVVVFTDTRGYDMDIWYYDLTTGLEHIVTTAVGDQALSAVSGNRIVYTDYQTTDVMLFDIATGETTNLTGGLITFSVVPAIRGNLVAWTDSRDGNMEIYAKDLVTGEERRITDNPLRDELPAVGEGTIVWQSCASSACQIYAYDWATGTTRQISAPSSTDCRTPDIDGHVVAYDRWASNERDIVVFNLDTGVEQVLQLHGEQFNPGISGSYVVFEDVASGTYHLKLWDVATGCLYDLPVNPTSGQFLNDIDGNRIVYTDDRNGQLDIYMYEFNISPNVVLSGKGVSRF